MYQVIASIPLGAHAKEKKKRNKLGLFGKKKKKKELSCINIAPDNDVGGEKKLHLLRILLQWCSG